MISQLMNQRTKFDGFWTSADHDKYFLHVLFPIKEQLRSKNYSCESVFNKAAKRSAAVFKRIFSFLLAVASNKPIRETG